MEDEGLRSTAGNQVGLSWYDYSSPGRRYAYSSAWAAQIAAESDLKCKCPRVPPQLHLVPAARRNSLKQTTREHVRPESTWIAPSRTTSRTADGPSCGSSARCRGALEAATERPDRRRGDRARGVANRPVQPECGRQAAVPPPARFGGEAPWHDPHETPADDAPTLPSSSSRNARNRRQSRRSTSC